MSVWRGQGVAGVAGSVTTINIKAVDENGARGVGRALPCADRPGAPVQKGFLCLRSLPSSKRKRREVMIAERARREIPFFELRFPCRNWVFWDRTVYLVGVAWCCLAAGRRRSAFITVVVVLVVRTRRDEGGFLGRAPGRGGDGRLSDAYRARPRPKQRPAYAPNCHLRLVLTVSTGPVRRPPSSSSSGSGAERASNFIHQPTLPRHRKEIAAAACAPAHGGGNVLRTHHSGHQTLPSWTAKFHSRTLNGGLLVQHICTATAEFYCAENICITRCQLIAQCSTQWWWSMHLGHAFQFISRGFTCAPACSSDNHLSFCVAKMLAPRCGRGDQALFTLRSHVLVPFDFIERLVALPCQLGKKGPPISL